MDVRICGIWRYSHRDADGNIYAFNGVYKEVDAPNRLVSTFEFEGAPGQIATDHVTFESMPDGKTRVVARTTADTLEALEAIVQSGSVKAFSGLWPMRRWLSTRM